MSHICEAEICGTCKVKGEDGSVLGIPDSIPGNATFEQGRDYMLAWQCKHLSALSLSEIQCQGMFALGFAERLKYMLLIRLYGDGLALMPHRLPTTRKLYSSVALNSARRIK